MQAAANEHVPDNPLAIPYSEVRATLFQMAQSITTQSQAITAQTNMEEFLKRTNMLVLWLTVRGILQR